MTAIRTLLTVRRGRAFTGHVRTLVTVLEGYLSSIRMRHQSTGDDSGLRHQSTN